MSQENEVIAEERKKRTNRNVNAGHKTRIKTALMSMQKIDIYYYLFFIFRQIAEAQIVDDISCSNQ